MTPHESRYLNQHHSFVSQKARQIFHDHITPPIHKGEKNFKNFP